ncbi:MAG: glycoside hydrolase family 16 protein [Flavobacteriaceae bacterium]|nr:glycoside hydrolase family 16 protein [Flavobacteriaceae bacterium]MCY4216954.1 glycoside hydrolase family 16 protein [Flavobacteriaceae bacterium]
MNTNRNGFIQLFKSSIFAPVVYPRLMVPSKSQYIVLVGLTTLLVFTSCSGGGFDPPPKSPSNADPNPVDPPSSNNTDPKLIWEDNFDGEALNDQNWTFDVGRGGWGNEELQNYTRGNHTVEKGMLTIEAKSSGPNSYSSSRIKTQGLQEFQYGRIEARIQLPEGQGLWPAFWLLGADIEDVGWPACGEIDIMEYVGREPGIFQNAIHTPSGHAGEASSKRTRVEDLEGKFHVYSVNWTAQAIEFYFNDRLTYQYSPSLKNNETYPFNKPMFILLNVAIGGTFGGPVGDNVVFPQKMIVDYVRVYEPD